MNTLILYLFTAHTFSVYQEIIYVYFVGEFKNINFYSTYIINCQAEQVTLHIKEPESRLFNCQRHDEWPRGAM